MTRLRVLYLCLFFLLLGLESRAICIDSARYVIKPVQCNGMRNGSIKVTQVFGGTQPYYYSIDGLSYSTNPEFSQLPSGEYLLRVRDSIGCQWQKYVLVAEPEELRVLIHTTDTIVVPGQVCHLSAEVTPVGSVLPDIQWGPAEYMYQPGSLVQQVQLSDSVVFYLRVKNASGCVAADSIRIGVRQSKVYFPNVIKTGNTENSFFTAYTGDGVSKIVEMKVFSRSGDLVFSENNILPNDPPRGWNGKWRNRWVQPGVYPWVAVLEFWDGTKHQFTGTVTVVRDAY